MRNNKRVFIYILGFIVVSYAIFIIGNGFTVSPKWAGYGAIIESINNQDPSLPLDGLEIRYNYLYPFTEFDDWYETIAGQSYFSEKSLFTHPRFSVRATGGENMSYTCFYAVSGYPGLFCALCVILLTAIAFLSIVPLPKCMGSYFTFNFLALNSCLIVVFNLLSYIFISFSICITVVCFIIFFAFPFVIMADIRQQILNRRGRKYFFLNLSLDVCVLLLCCLVLSNVAQLYYSNIWSTLCLLPSLVVFVPKRLWQPAYSWIYLIIIIYGFCNHILDLTESKMNITVLILSACCSLATYSGLCFKQFEKFVNRQLR